MQYWIIAKPQPLVHRKPRAAESRKVGKTSRTRFNSAVHAKPCVQRNRDERVGFAGPYCGGRNHESMTDPSEPDRPRRLSPAQDAAASAELAQYGAVGLIIAGVTLLVLG